MALNVTAEKSFDAPTALAPPQGGARGRASATGAASFGTIIASQRRVAADTENTASDASGHTNQPGTEAKQTEKPYEPDTAAMAMALLGVAPQAPVTPTTAVQSPGTGGPESAPETGTKIAPGMAMSTGDVTAGASVSVIADVQSGTDGPEPEEPLEKAAYPAALESQPGRDQAETPPPSGPARNAKGLAQVGAAPAQLDPHDGATHIPRDTGFPAPDKANASTEIRSEPTLKTELSTPPSTSGQSAGDGDGGTAREFSDGASPMFELANAGAPADKNVGEAPGPKEETQASGTDKAEPDRAPLPHLEGHGDSIPATAPPLAMPAQATGAISTNNSGTVTPQNNDMPLSLNTPGWTETLVDSIRHNKDMDSDTLDITLTPHHLGRLHVRLEMRDGVATVGIVTDTADAARILNDNQQKLAEAFAQSGLQLGNHSADLNSGRGNGQAQHRIPETPGAIDIAGPDTPEPLLTARVTATAIDLLA